MRKIGIIDISFKEYLEGVYYYNLDIDIQGIKKHISLPRYHTFLGWIEVFGLPPQNEWVALKAFDNFTKTGTIVIDGENISEKVTYGYDSVSGVRTVETLREAMGLSEHSVWKQYRTDAVGHTKSEVSFTHSHGEYFVHVDTAVCAGSTVLFKEQQVFVDVCKQERGAPDLVLLKKFSVQGVPPPLYYRIFPPIEMIDLGHGQGSLLEVGYFRKNSTYEVDHVHGDWYKRFDDGKNILKIVESNYTSCDVEIGGKVERIKNTYRKELFRVK